LLGGCTAKVPKNHYYTLRAELPAPPPPASPLPVSLAVARFTAASRALGQERLVYRTAPHRVDFYEYHRWTDAPPDLVARVLIDRLAASGLFRSVTRVQTGSASDFILGGRVESLEEIDSGQDVSARVAITAELTDAKTGAIVWTGRGAKEAPVRDRSVDGVVQALNEALADSLEQITRSLLKKWDADQRR
jgi:ABC-type uncharacterized transport system auxiliary subunit